MPEFERPQKPKTEPYILRLRHDFLTPFYDLLMQWGTRESAFKPRLVEQARIQKAQRILDVGCGTATLTILSVLLGAGRIIKGIKMDYGRLRNREAEKKRIAREGLRR